ncbi:hypothetical protein FA13DRAFT_1723561 [Coprinellus micaceus]|uniref:Uncharacterized protein n=1 Tax=Coprinellus micaceus TaxID=71717 RepID=A0A4Y7R4B0_COPMI|nr:hypothetical protein FA13DRAFT_1723561 [Coprinellus micaceus]
MSIHHNRHEPPPPPYSSPPPPCIICGSKLTGPNGIGVVPMIQLAVDEWKLCQGLLEEVYNDIRVPIIEFFNPRNPPPMPGAFPEDQMPSPSAPSRPRSDTEYSALPPLLTYNLVAVSLLSHSEQSASRNHNRRSPPIWTSLSQIHQIEKMTQNAGYLLEDVVSRLRRIVVAADSILHDTVITKSRERLNRCHTALRQPHLDLAPYRLSLNHHVVSLLLISIQERSIDRWLSDLLKEVQGIDGAVAGMIRTAGSLESLLDVTRATEFKFQQMPSESQEL